MNKNDKKRIAGKKGHVDPRSVKDFKVYKKTTLMEFLQFKMPQSSRNTIKSLLTHHLVAVGGVMVSKFDYPLVEEDVVTISKRPISKKRPTDISIIFEDDDLIAIDKPSGLLSVASDTEKGKTAYRLVSDYLSNKEKGSRAYVVHRLDEDTSGVLVFAKSSEVRDALQHAWGEIVTKRGYYAIVEGEIKNKQGTLKNLLTQDSFQLTKVTRDPKKGKMAITNYKVVKSESNFSLVDVNIETGRKNQIRVQFGHIGHYVLGDDKYGEPSDPLGRLALHAYELDFKNPLNGKKYNLHSKMPDSFKKFCFGEGTEASFNKNIKKHNEKTRSQIKIDKAKTSFKAYRRRKLNGKR